MCGISGFLSKLNHPPNTLERMLNAIRHRGPDDQVQFHDGPYNGGMCRLAINDLEFGGQPLFNTEQTVVVLYNGEIYNSPQLRNELIGKGYQFRTHSDGEVICHLYDEYGENLFERLDGMFAIALWDTDKEQLLLARDLAGEKPLYYAKRKNGDVVFASEIRAIRKFPEIDLSLNFQAIWDFPTFLWVPEPETVFNEIVSIPRGCVLRICNGNISLESYENKFKSSVELLCDEDIIAETRRVVTEAVRSRLLSDVPVGCFLSGGLDSSIVTTLAAQELGSIDTFCVGFESLSDPYHGTSDESDAAEKYAEKLGCRHHKIQVSSEDFRNDLQNFVYYSDQPFGVSSGLGVLAVARAAQQSGLKVLLSGDCADECFGGYSWYPHLSGKVDSMESVRGTIPISFQNFGISLKKRLEVLNSYDAPTRAWAWHYYAHESEKSRLFSREFQQGLNSSIRHFQNYDESLDWSPKTFISQDRDFYLPQEMLRKVDRMTMACSIEGRVPFAAPAVLSLAERLPYPSMVKGNVLKWSLRQAFSDILPSEIVDRPKHGFNVPIDHWLKGDWSDLVDEAFAEGSALRRNRFVAMDAGKVAKNMLNDPNRLNGHTIFCYILLNQWLEGVH